MSKMYELSCLSNFKIAKNFNQEVRRSAAILKLITKAYLNSVPLAFLKWKMISKVRNEDYDMFKLRKQKMSKVIENYLRLISVRQSNAFSFWKFQTQHNAPFYKQESVGALICRATNHANDYGLIKDRVHGDHNIATPMDILIKLSNVKELLDNRFKKQKRDFFWKLKMYSQLEHMMLQSRQPLLLRTMRLNERKYYDNIRKYNQNEIISPRRFMRMLETKNDHE